MDNEPKDVMVAKAKISHPVRGQTILPDGSRLDAKETDSRLESEAISLTPTDSTPEPWAELKAFWASGGFSADFMSESRAQDDFDDRPDLDVLFASED